MASTDESKSRLLRLAERRERRLTKRGPWPRRFVAVGAVIATTTATGIAYAAWTGTAAGTAAAKAGTLTFTVSATAPSIPGSGFNTVHPGSVAGGSGDTLGGDLVVTINNTSGFALKATAVIQADKVTVGGSPLGTCASDTGTFPNQASNSTVFIGTQAPAAFGAATTGTFITYTLPTPVTIPTGTSTVQLNNVVGMGSASLTGCQSGTFSIPVTITASS